MRSEASHISEEEHMRRKHTWLMLWIASTTIVVLEFGGPVRATPASGFAATTLAKGTFADFHVINHLTLKELQQLAPGFPAATWTSMESTQGPSDLYLQSNTWQPGGSTGWHQHPGHSLIIITSGVVTQYHADCAPQAYGPGMPNGATLVDSGDDEHLVRNDGSVVATGFAVQIVASGAPRRIDEPAPDSCPAIF
jgi:hypothetical protein